MHSSVIVSILTSEIWINSKNNFVLVFFLGSGEQNIVDKTELLDTTGWREDLQEMKKGNLLLEREKLNLEIKMLKFKMAKLEH